jgi:hypothetical protein
LLPASSVLCFDYDADLNLTGGKPGAELGIGDALVPLVELDELLHHVIEVLFKQFGFVGAGLEIGS